MSSLGTVTNAPESYGICCIMEGGQRCEAQASNTIISRNLHLAINQERGKLCVDPEAEHSYVCEQHRSIIHTMKAKRRRKDSEEESDFQQEVDFLQLPMITLHRYKRHYKLQLKPSTSKIQLVEAITKHFKTIRVIEKKTVPLFISMVKSHKSKLDRPKPLEPS
ncbi:hypothetical protein EMCRGX_G033672 [Ephydatia muelleri]|eukprot:Em0022g520a